MVELSAEEYKQAALQVLVKVDAICREYGIRYMLGYGTLLGAVRHRGFIPWDDDIDIVLMRGEYNRLMDIIEGNKEEFGLNFISIENYPDTVYPYGKICDTSTILYEKGYRHVEGLGVFVDVFPWDNISEDQLVQRKNRTKYFNLIRLIMHSSKIKMPKGLGMNSLKKRAAYVIAKPFNTSKLIEKANRAFQEFNQRETGFVGFPWDKPYPAGAVDKLCDMEFEGHLFPVPARYDEVLTIKYGDYMTLPSESERVNKHDFVCYRKPAKQEV